MYALLGILMIVAPTLFIVLYIKKKKDRMLYASIGANLFLILSVVGMSMNHDEELLSQSENTQQVEGMIDFYFNCIDKSETFDDVVDCNTAFAAKYDYYTGR